jgi:hypothetical protein
MRQALFAEFVGTAGLLTVVVGSGIMGERLAGEHFPVLPPGTRKVHWPLNDPAKDPEDEIIAVFRATRDEVNERVTGFIARPRDESAA